MTTSRLEALARLVEAAAGRLKIVDEADGWPAQGTLLVAGQSIGVALYVGILGVSHRGRDELERRFQNPGQDRPIRYSPARPMLLLGIQLSEDLKGVVVVGFDPSRRVGRRTRFSMFASAELLAASLECGWTETTTTSNEVLVAFHPRELDRYLMYRYPSELLYLSEGVDMPDSMTLVHDLRALLGFGSPGELGQRLSARLEAPEPIDDEGVADLLTTLAKRLGVLGDGGLGWPSALAAAAALDDRVSVMLTLWDELAPAVPPPRSHRAFVTRIYEDSRILGVEAPESVQECVREIARACESELDDEDLELFISGDTPTIFFYESVRSHIDAAQAGPAESEAEDDDLGFDDEDDEEQAQPVKASVDKLQVVQVFNLVTKKRLDIEPPWQRKDVWSLKKKRELIKSLILGIPLPSIILHNQDGKMSIIDGKQRLTAIIQFLQNEWKLPNYKVSPGSPLNESRGAFYNKENKKSLSVYARDTLELRNIPALIFEDVPESRLRKIFELYNVAGMKLNAAEIRNAVYQSNPIHRIIYVLAGEGDGRSDLGIGGVDVQRAFAEKLRRIYPGSRKRYQGVDFLARYLGYSRATQRPGSGQFREPSTSAAINNYFDYGSHAEDPVKVARELVDVMRRAEDFFDLDSERLAFFVRNDKGQRQFNKLVATTHMVAGRFLGELIDRGLVAESDARSAASAVAVPPPENQQRATIWDYQARILLGLREHLEIDVPSALCQDWVHFFEKMEYCLLPTESQP